MKIIVLGMGLMGPTVAKDCVADPLVELVIGCDIDEVQLKKAASRVKSKKFITKKINIIDHNELVSVLTSNDIVVNCTAARLSLNVLKAAMEAKVNLIDMAGGGYPQEGEIYNEVEKAGITAIPGCGVDPGLIDILCGKGMEEMDSVEDVSFACGGLPMDPKPPLDYKIVFGGTRMPLRPGKVPMIVDGKLVELDRYSEVESIFVDGYRDMEAFIDGYPSSLLRLCLEKNVNTFKGKTIRYDGFVDKITFLIQLGVASSKPVQFQGKEIIPVELLHELIYPIVKFDETAGDRDITVMLTSIKGKKNEQSVEITHEMLDEYDEEEKITSMAKTTGYTAAIVARILGSGRIKKKGILWPVRVIKGALAEELLSGLKKRGVEVTETVVTTREI